MPVKKAPAKATKALKKTKPASKTAPVAKKVAKKSNTKPASKTAVKKATAPKVAAAKTEPRGKDSHGMRVGTDLSIAAAEIIKGGASRVEVIERLTKMLDNSTRTGRPKAVASVLAQAVKRLEEDGYVEESHWRMVPKKESASASTGVDSAPSKVKRTKPVKKMVRRKATSA